MERYLALFHPRLDEAHKQIRTIMPPHKKDLVRMHKQATEVWAKMSNEAINCRRMRRETHDYTVLNDKLEVLLDQLEQYITFAKLLG